MSHTINRVCVYCASSDRPHPEHAAAARRLGTLLARAGIAIVYGGSNGGSMGALARGALEAGGTVAGVIPRFMEAVEGCHPGLSELERVDTMHERKAQMLARADAVIALPGGWGTYEELFEAISLKRLGLFSGPIVLVNVRGAFDPLLALLYRTIADGFMREQHRAIWTAVDSPDAVLDALLGAPDGDTNAQPIVAAG